MQDRDKQELIEQYVEEAAKNAGASEAPPAMMRVRTPSVMSRQSVASNNNRPVSPSFGQRQGGPPPQQQQQPPQQQQQQLQRQASLSRQGGPPTMQQQQQRNQQRPAGMNPANFVPQQQQQQPPQQQQRGMVPTPQQRGLQPQGGPQMQQMQRGPQPGPQPQHQQHQRHQTMVQQRPGFQGPPPQQQQRQRDLLPQNNMVGPTPNSSFTSARQLSPSFAQRPQNGMVPPQQQQQQQQQQQRHPTMVQRGPGPNTGAPMRQQSFQQQQGPHQGGGSQLPSPRNPPQTQPPMLQAPPSGGTATRQPSFHNQGQAAPQQQQIIRRPSMQQLPPRTASPPQQPTLAPTSSGGAGELESTLTHPQSQQRRASMGPQDVVVASSFTSQTVPPPHPPAQPPTTGQLDSPRQRQETAYIDFNQQRPSSARTYSDASCQTMPVQVRQIPILRHSGTQVALLTDPPPTPAQNQAAVFLTIAQSEEKVGRQEIEMDHQGEWQHIAALYEAAQRDMHLQHQRDLLLDQESSGRHNLELFENRQRDTLHHHWDECMSETNMYMLLSPRRSTSRSIGRSAARTSSTGGGGGGGTAENTYGGSTAASLISPSPPSDMKVVARKSGAADTSATSASVTSEYVPRDSAPLPVTGRGLVAPLASPDPKAASRSRSASGGAARTVTPQTEPDTASSYRGAVRHLAEAIDQRKWRPRRSPPPPPVERDIYAPSSDYTYRYGSQSQSLSPRAVEPRTPNPGPTTDTTNGRTDSEEAVLREQCFRSLNSRLVNLKHMSSPL
eukprot:PhM_4_TR9551/c0_g1_i2/m.64376